MGMIIGVKNRINAYRNPVYLLYVFGGILITLFAGIIAESGVGGVEESIFYTFNRLSGSFYYWAILFLVFGTALMVPIVAFIALLRRHYANAIRILLAGGVASSVCTFLNNRNISNIPESIRNNVIDHGEGSFELLVGFPSSFMAIAAVLALTSYTYIPKRFHKIITGLVLLVGVSQLYLGIHLPIDLIGGWGVGLAVGGLMNFIFGSRRYNPVSPEVVKEKLTKLNLRISEVKIASVDARGSVPYIAKGKPSLFIKIVGIDNNVADLLFKSFRRIIYRRLEDEQPYLSAKRQLEHEAYVAMLAKKAGVNTPDIVAIFEAETDRWAMAQVMIPGKSLDSIDPKRISNKVLESIWKEVKTLHDNHIIHRDLRAANIFLDDKNEPWIIDFGFSEASIKPESFYRDTVELVASLSLLVGIDRTVDSAIKVIGKDELRHSLPYLSFSSLSGATTSAYKKQRKEFKKLKSKLIKATGVKKVKSVEMKRLNFKTFLILVSLGVAIYVLAPQFVNLGDSLDAAKGADWRYIGVGVVLSAFTYFLSGLAYKFMTIYPVKLWPTVLIQVASSFASKVAPAGTGGIALNGRYLYKNNHDITQAGAVATLNTILGLLGHISVVVFISLFTPGSVVDLLPDIHVSLTIVIFSALAVLSIIISAFAFPAMRKLFTKGRRKVFEQFAFYWDNPSKIILGYLASVAITLTYTATLYFSALALGIHLDILDAIYVFTFGAIVATVTPTPGGIGGAEAAFVAGLTTVGVDTPTALTITLLYRLLTFWLPILPGFLAFRQATKKEYI